ncbi:hypothetical protein BC936DRAFT_143149 [Jimgerdemannia flammicorona]|uniref:Uncharacterized protein n=1 Tax=Jimgerdemannia flammicorona TaxID=994334 RepID=A0A433DE69_9FUNG|nr:hypothetical protein BC936DRAFT_143149 [Jimgerdemannia flammicorona]
MGDAYLATLKSVRLCQNIFDVPRIDLLGVLSSLREVFFSEEHGINGVDIEEDSVGTHKREKLGDGDVVIGQADTPTQPIAQPVITRAPTPPPLQRTTNAETAPRTPPQTLAPAFKSKSPRSPYKPPPPDLPPKKLPNLAAGPPPSVSASTSLSQIKRVPPATKSSNSVPVRVAATVTKPVANDSAVPVVTNGGMAAVARPVPVAANGATVGVAARPASGAAGVRPTVAVAAKKSVAAATTTKATSSQPATTRPAAAMNGGTAPRVQVGPATQPQAPQTPTGPLEPIASLRMALLKEVKKVPPHYDSVALFTRLDAVERETRYTSAQKVDLATKLLVQANIMKRKELIAKLTEMKEKNM